MTDGATAAYLRRVQEALAQEFALEQSTYDGRLLLVGRRSDFRLRWFAVRLKTTITVGQFETDVAVGALDAYLAATNRESRSSHGTVPRGLQTGAAGISVAVLPQMTQAAHDWAARSHGHEFAALAYPVAVGVEDKVVVQPQRLIIGRVFAGFMRDIVASVIAAPLRPRSG